MRKEEICKGICCGCTACANICPTHSITMKEDKKGFLYPEINESTCTNCELCSKVCNSVLELKKNKETYIAKHLDEKVLLSSQSGGAFTAISDCILDKKEVVYGAALDKAFEAFHVRSENKEQRNAMRGSKYIPSRLCEVYTQVKDDLNGDRYVLFTGLPCQVGGLLKYLKMKKINTDKLFTVDIICHGTPSVLLWRDLIKYYQNKYNDKITQAIFRDKLGGGVERPHYNFYVKKKLVSDVLHRKLFYSNLALRDSCYQCEYTKITRVGDFTIGDAWGVKEKNPDFFDTRGVSLIMVNSEKARELIPQLKETMQMKNVPLENYIQGNMCRSSQPHRNKNEFWADYFNKDFSYIIKKYAYNNIFLNYKYIIKKLIHKLRK